MIAIILVATGALAAQDQSQLTSIPAGTSISVRTIEAIDSKTADVNRKYAASLAEPLMVGSVQIAPRNADVRLRVVEDKQAGAVSGRTTLVLQVASVSINGQMILVDTGTTVKESGSQGAKSAKRGILGAALGAGIGAIAGGGKGAAIGAGAGGTAGVVSAAISGERVKVPSETRLFFTVSQDTPLPGPLGPRARAAWRCQRARPLAPESASRERGQTRRVLLSSTSYSAGPMAAAWRSSATSR